MSDLSPDEAVGYPVMGIAHIIRHDLDETLLANDASESRGLYALALALAWRLQAYPKTERAILHAGLADSFASMRWRLAGSDAAALGGRPREYQAGFRSTSRSRNAA